MKYQVREYIDEAGRSPFRRWLKSLAIAVQARVQARIFRAEQGNFGDHKSVGDGVWELRIPAGPGFRVYFAKDGKEVILLLVGGDKSSQRSDIHKAKTLWADYKEHRRAKKK